MCVDLLDSLQQRFTGSNYQLLSLSVAGESAYSVYYIDTVHIGQAVTAVDPSGNFWIYYGDVKHDVIH